MNRHLDKLEPIIARSSLSLDERQDLTSILLRADDAILQLIVDLCLEDTGLVEKLQQNYKSKRAAIAADDPDAWERIIREEEQTLREMATQNKE